MEPTSRRRLLFFIDPDTEWDDVEQLAEELNMPDSGTLAQFAGSGPGLTEILLVVSMSMNAVTTADKLLDIADKVSRWHAKRRAYSKPTKVHIERPDGSVIDLEGVTDEDLIRFVTALKTPPQLPDPQEPDKMLPDTKD